MYFSQLTITYIKLSIIDWTKVSSYLDTSLANFVFNDVFSVPAMHNAEFILTGILKQEVDHQSYRIGWS